VTVAEGRGVSLTRLHVHWSGQVETGGTEPIMYRATRMEKQTKRVAGKGPEVGP